jgi:hypothetical protein
MPDRSIAQANAEAALCAQAKRIAHDVVKHRARGYLLRPMTQDALVPGLSQAPAETIIAIAKNLIAAETHVPRRWFGFGGEIPLLNAKALLLCGRILRRAAHRRQRDKRATS